MRRALSILMLVIGPACEPAQPPAPTADSSELLPAAATPPADVAAAAAAVVTAGPEWTVAITTDLVLDGCFRPEQVIFHPSRTVLVPDKDKPWIPVPAQPDMQGPGTMLASEFCIDPSQLEALIAPAGNRTGVVREVLSPEFEVKPDGRMNIRWVGAGQGLIAMRSGATKPGERASFHAVESATEEPMEFILKGVPAAREGSLTFELTEYLDRDVATRMTIHAPKDGVILATRDEQGVVTLRPGRLTE